MDQYQQRVEILEDWGDGGRQGIALGDTIDVNGQDWTPVLWDGEDDPEFFKTEGLKFIP